MNNTEELKSIIKERWLDYYEINQDWIVKFTNGNKGWVDCSSGGSRPNAFLILGAITSSDPRISDWMSIFCQLQSDSNELIRVLGLDFDPDEAIKIRIQQREEGKDKALTKTVEVIGLLCEDLEYKAANEGLNQIREKIKQENSS
jgi:hypothetical protein